jgi:kynurenine formamidase
MNSGWQQHVTNAAKFVGKDAAGVMHFPGIHPEATEWLVKERSVVGLAVDTLSLDPGNSKDFKTHYTWLPTGRWGIENIANLDKVPATGATLVAGLPKVKDATGGPARILAMVLSGYLCLPSGRSRRPASRSPRSLRAFTSVQRVRAAATASSSSPSNSNTMR